MKTTLNFQDADAFYESLLDAHSGLSREESELLNARLILIMANQLGDSAQLQACIAAARQMAPPSARSAPLPREAQPVE